MKILQVITSLSTGGAEKLISEITPMLRDKGHQVDVLAFDGADTAFKKALTDKGINSTAIRTVAISVEKYGCPIPPAKKTTSPCSTSSL